MSEDIKYLQKSHSVTVKTPKYSVGLWLTMSNHKRSAEFFPLKKSPYYPRDISAVAQPIKNTFQHIKREIFMCMYLWPLAQEGHARDPVALLFC